MRRSANCLIDKELKQENKRSRTSHFCKDIDHDLICGLQAPETLQWKHFQNSVTSTLFKELKLLLVCRQSVRGKLMGAREEAGDTYTLWVKTVLLRAGIVTHTLILALREQGQADCYEFRASLVCRANPGQLGLCYTEKPCLKGKKMTKKTSVYCSSKGSEFNSKYPHWVSQNCQ